MTEVFWLLVDSPDLIGTHWTVGTKGQGADDWIYAVVTSKGVEQQEGPILAAVPYMSREEFQSDNLPEGREQHVLEFLDLIQKRVEESEILWRKIECLPDGSRLYKQRTGGWKLQAGKQTVTGETAVSVVSEVAVESEQWKQKEEQ